MADLSGVPHAPRSPNSFNFMECWGKFGKILCLRPPGGLAPYLWEILDPPLAMLCIWGQKSIIWSFGKILLKTNENERDWTEREACVPSAPSFGSVWSFSLPDM